MSTELERWETAPWDPHNYDRTRRLLTSLATKIVLAEAILIVLFNGIILFLGIRNKELRTSAANLLFLSLCTGNMLFGVFLIVFRIMDLQPDFLWAKVLYILLDSTDGSFKCGQRKKKKKKNFNL
ncbi:hypothetical protein BC828DRAFT_385680 [Blastocladiella britannica]|nr:hypothetical protein BC828DRAFT_385680 [Blastocladiella britannica]